MKVLVNSIDEIYPSLESLSKYNLKYEIMADGRVRVELDDSKIRICENKDMTNPNTHRWPRDIANQMPNEDKSLSYFVINNHTIIASGDLYKGKDGNYTCDGAFRVFSEIAVTTFDYVLSSQVSVENWDSLNGAMLDATSKNVKTR